MGGIEQSHDGGSRLRKDSNAPISSDAFRLLRSAVMPSSSPNSSLTGNSSGSETLVSRFSRRSNRDRHPARDPSDRSHTPLRCDRSRSPLQYDRRSRSRVTDGSEH
ncbi:hypothetical protein OUZ56_028012 [Daphnia magna]|uniref:Uncharacterized protein n=1 Tax=Daphnia magna TaxID=35525 RepID=A0ABR0B2K4_9CRUS|nr:hypothetical protein OUZ56_028012 [Daphnia magna]